MVKMGCAVYEIRSLCKYKASEQPEKIRYFRQIKRMPSYGWRRRVTTLFMERGPCGGLLNAMWRILCQLSCFGVSSARATRLLLITAIRV